MRRFFDLSDDLGDVLAAAGVGVWRWDPATGIVQWTGATEEIYGLESGAFEGTFDAFAARIHPDDVDQVLGMIGSMSESGGDYSVRHRVVWPDGTIRWVEGQGRIILGEDRAPVAGLGIVYDVSDRMGLEQERNQLRLLEAEARSSSEEWQSEVEFLIQVSDALNASLNVERVAAKLASLLVSQLADGCVVDIRLDTPRAEVLTAADAGCLDRPHAVTARGTSDDPAARRLAFGVTDRASADRGGLVDLLGGLPDLSTSVGQQVSWLAEPLRARGKRIGTVIAWVSDREWTEQGRRLFAAVVRRAGGALDAAELYRERSAVAAEFHRSINLSVLPDIEDWDVDVRHVPATELVRMSGDFFDVFALPDGSWMLAVGDVCGKGIAAAGQSGLARAALRAAAQVATHPAEALSALNRVLLLDPDQPMVTAVVARLAIEDGVRIAEVGSAGHPQPLVVRDDGSWAEVAVKGTMLGYSEKPEFVTTRLELRPGDALVLYTDGVTEARTGDEFFRLERLAKAVAEVAGVSAKVMAEAGMMSADLWVSEESRDDVAILVAMAEG